MIHTNIKRVLLFLFASILFVVLGMLHPISAHFPVTDGNMTAILHVDPNDNPIPGQQSMLYFLFDDISNQFSLKNCQCIVTVSEDGSPILMKALQPGEHVGIYGQGIPIIFPKRDVYTITIQGNPRIDGTFQSFIVTWNFRVEQYPLENINTLSLQDILVPVGIAVGISVFLFVLIFVLVSVSNRLSQKNSILSQRK